MKFDYLRKNRFVTSPLPVHSLCVSVCIAPCIKRHIQTGTPLFFMNLKSNASAKSQTIRLKVDVMQTGCRVHICISHVQ